MAADVTIFNRTGVQIEVINGNPPVDQSAEVAALQAQVATLTTERDAALAKIAAAKDKLAVLAAADAAEDAARAEALAALG